ncbi:mitochondrial carrier domain-containing protein [Phlyctochytrium arcticum]|nr:mitochondrial carrier domain-containing protein [Phlyctochytrium arcticum]
MPLTPFQNATAGALGALSANSAVYPLDVIKTRLQVQTKEMKHLNPGQHYDSVMDAVVKIVKSEGLPGLYSGLGAGLLGTVFSSFSYFYFYSYVRGSYLKRVPGEISTSMELVLGAIAGAMSQLCTLPVAVVTTRQQTASKEEHLSFLDTMKKIVADEGVGGLWKGLQASLILCVNPAITYGMFERLKTIFMKRQDGKMLTAGQTFVIGAISKALATVVTYPYIMAKVRMQWKPPKTMASLSAKDQENLTYKSAADILQKTLKNEGIAGWYKGLQPQIVKAVICQAVLFVCKDQFATLTLAIFALLARGKARAAQLKSST